MKKKIIIIYDDLDNSWEMPDFKIKEAKELLNIIEVVHSQIINIAQSVEDIKKNG